MVTKKNRLAIRGRQEMYEGNVEGGFFPQVGLFIQVCRTSLYSQGVIYHPYTTYIDHTVVQCMANSRVFLAHNIFH